MSTPRNDSDGVSRLEKAYRFVKSEASRGAVAVVVSFRAVVGGQAHSIYCPTKKKAYWAVAAPESTEALEVGCRFTCAACKREHRLISVSTAVGAGILTWDSIPEDAIATVGDSSRDTDYMALTKPEGGAISA